MSKAIIFGVNGQDGHYLKEKLLGANIDCIGVSRSSGDWISLDVGDPSGVEQIIRREKPDFIFNLAATSSTGPELLIEHQHTIVGGTLNILKASLQYSPQARVFITGSGLQFSKSIRPIKESDCYEASDSYSLARIQSCYMARYFRQIGLATYIGYLFHHDSPFRKPNHLSQRIVIAAQEAAVGKHPKIEIGDIAIEKEFGFAGDIAEAILTLVLQETVTEACIGTGKAYPISKWIQLCFDSVNLDWKRFIRIKKGFEGEFIRLESDPSTMYSLGWMPNTNIAALAKIMMSNYING
jgi:GDPmannose 4,6-dehydratase